MHAIPIIYLFVVDVAVFFFQKKKTSSVIDAIPIVCMCTVVFRLNNIVIFQRVRIYLFFKWRRIRSSKVEIRMQDSVGIITRW